MSKVVVTMVTLNREHVDAVLRDFDFVAEIKRSTEIARGAGLSGNCNDDSRFPSIVSRPRPHFAPQLGGPRFGFQEALMP